MKYFLIPVLFKLRLNYKNINYEKKYIPLTAIITIQKNKSMNDSIEKEIRLQYYKKKLKNFIIW